MLKVYMNGQEASQPIPVHVNLDPVCVYISTQYLKFAPRGPGQDGIHPDPVLNNITFSIYGSSNPNVQAFVQANEIGVLPGILSFQAMAPVIMIHGWRSGPWYWGPSPSTTTPCGADKNFSPFFARFGIGYDGGFNFIQPFVLGKYPFDCSIQIGQNALIDVGAAALEIQVKLTLGGFGARHAHLVAHSKGGLWTRKMLSNVITETDGAGNHPFGVLSMTTLSAPELGSSLADLIVTAHEYPWLNFRKPRLVVGLFRSSAGVEDLRVANATGNNSLLGPPPGKFTVDGIQNDASQGYWAFSADADINGNGKIDGATNPGDEGYPGLYSLSARLNTVIANQRYQWLGKIQQVSVNYTTILGRKIPTSVALQPTGTFQNDDLAVTVPSALGAPGFATGVAATGRCGSLPCFQANHSTIGGASTTASQVLAIIQAAQTVQ